MPREGVEVETPRCDNGEGGDEFDDDDDDDDDAESLETLLP